MQPRMLIAAVSSACKHAACTQILVNRVTTSNMYQATPLGNRFKPSSKIFLLTVRSMAVLLWIICVIYVSCLSCFPVCSLCCLVVTWWERVDLLALVCDVYCDFDTFPFGILLDCIISWSLLSFFFFHQKPLPASVTGSGWHSVQTVIW